MTTRQLLDLAQLIEQYASLGIFVVAAVLGAFSYLAWRRERDRRMKLVTVGYALFALYGLVGFLEYVLLSHVQYAYLELVEHASAILILAGLLVFFASITRA
jgi:uncharacterized membrane protein